MKIIQLLPALIFLLSSLVISKGDVPNSPLSTSGEVRHAGSEVPLADAEGKSSLVFVGLLEILGNFDLADEGVASYRNTKIKIISVLKGELKDKSEIQVGIFPRLVYGKGFEATPKVGSTYIFFVKTDNGNRYEAIKLLEATDDNIAKVKALIDAAPASK
jgi:hypothetical protein